MNWEEKNIKGKIDNLNPHPCLPAGTAFPLSQRERGDHRRNAWWVRALTICFGFLILFFGIYSFADAKEFDGLWFIGFNFKHELFQDVRVRQAIVHCLDRNYIMTAIMSEEVLPGSFIPPGMTGYDPSLKPYKFNPGYAKTLMQRAQLPPSNRRLKTIKLLHTDGVKTIAIAQNIQNDLKKIGMKIELIQISYRDQNRWQQELSSGTNDLFLMGYKADIEKVFSSEAGAAEIDSSKLIDPLFKSNGEANFTGYTNTNLDSLLGQLASIGPGLKSERAAKLKEINKILYKELPVVILFYIEKL